MINEQISITVPTPVIGFTLLPFLRICSQTFLEFMVFVS